MKNKGLAIFLVFCTFFLIEPVAGKQVSIAPHAIPVKSAADVKKVCANTTITSGQINRITENGDVFLVDGNLLKLADLHLPREAETGSLSSRLLDFLRQFETHRISYVTIGKRDRHNRHHAHIFSASKETSNPWIQSYLIENALAFFMPTLSGKPHKNPPCIENVLARSLRTLAPAPPALSNAKPNSYRNIFHQVDDQSLWNKEGEFVIVTGQILKTSLVGKTVFINFGQDFKRDFTITLSPALQSLIENEEKKLSLTPGKWVKLRGYLDLFNGPAIHIDHPLQVEFLD